MNDDLLKMFESFKLDGVKVVVDGNICSVIDKIKNTFSFDILKSITAIDLTDKTELIYHLYSTINDEDLVLSKVVYGNEIESVSRIFPSAIADEREIFDLFGINFTGHKDLKRLYMPDNWVGNPLKKDYTENDSRLMWNDENNN